MMTEQQAKATIMPLIGLPVVVKYNHGRNKIGRYKGTLTSAHSNIFVVDVEDTCVDRLCCSYCDIICGIINIAPANK